MVAIAPGCRSTAGVIPPTSATSGERARASASAKVTRVPRKPVVDALATLLAVTSSALDCATAPAAAT